ncbi:MAG: S8 family serine peptidase, partial [Clostridia bacterium]|nr:S8 family serine peptidase [Clostridia bacterium]
TYPGGRYRVLSGTSMAAPHVTGIAALLLGARLQLRGGEVRQLLVASCRPVATLPREEQGAGLPSARQAVQALLGGQRARAS